MYGWLVPNIVFPLYERLSGRRLWTEVLRLRDLQWRSTEELEARAFEKLRPLLAHAAAHVPFYRDLFKQAGIQPDDLRSVSDLSRVPITRKADLRASFPANTTADNLPAWRRLKMTTSGSSGFLFEFYMDRAGMDSWLGSHLFFLEWAGAALWDTRIIIAGSPSYRSYRSHVPGSFGASRGLRRLLLGERVIYLPGATITAAEFRARTAPLSRNRSYFIRAYPSHATRLAAQLLAEEGRLPAYPKVVITGAETLTPANTAAMQAAFRCPVVNQYGAWEVPHMAQTCPDNPEVLHVNSERVILRVVRADGSPAAPGERGRVVITALSNSVMPFINYDLGDWAVGGETCPCGRGLPTLISVDGRVGEIIRTRDGRAIDDGSLTTFLTSVCHAIPYVWEYQAVQTAPDTVLFRVVPTSRFSAEYAGSLRGNLEDFLGPDVTVLIETLDHIPPESSGKRLIIKSLPPV